MLIVAKVIVERRRESLPKTCSLSPESIDGSHHVEIRLPCGYERILEATAQVNSTCAASWQ